MKLPPGLIVVRKIVCDTLAEDPSLAIAGSTGEGLAALAKLPLVNPDLVTLDIEMPGMRPRDVG